MNRVRAFRPESFEADTPGFPEAARSEARRLLSAALAERDRIREAAREEGRTEGRAEGLRQGREEAAAELARLGALLEETTAGLRARREEIAGLSEGGLIRLAVAIAERIIKVEVRDRAWDIAAANLRRAMELAVQDREAVVRVHPEDLEALKERLPGIVAAFPEGRGIRLRPDEHLVRGGCVIETGKGGVDADLSTQLDEIERGLLG